MPSNEICQIIFRPTAYPCKIVMRLVMTTNAIVDYLQTHNLIAYHTMAFKSTHALNEVPHKLQLKICSTKSMCTHLQFFDCFQREVHHRADAVTDPRHDVTLPVLEPRTGYNKRLLLAGNSGSDVMLAVT